MRADPSGIVTLGDLARVGLVRSYDGAKRLPPALPLPVANKCWEARTILDAFGLLPRSAAPVGMTGAASPPPSLFSTFPASPS